MDSPSTRGNVISAFVADPYVRSAWIAFFTLWVLWGLTYFLRHVFARDNTVGNVNKGTGADVDPEVGGTTGNAPGVTNTTETSHKRKWYSGGSNHNTTTNTHNSLYDRFARAHEILKENTLLLLSVLVLNTFGAGSTRAVMILAWIYFAFTCLHAFTEVGYHHHYIRLLFNVLFFALTLAMGGLAFHLGWHTFGSIF
ncbi:uncharacterized protein BX663DRAFT_506317 [Cokeromyces recurvatus]|uniref:uncharacterized protein n=1 Tax=Cokeromyces recurvatus TaxID=90255 RepID=UPI00221FEFF2|nr:uncharacterized protein BX663DRAFT_506317 [Cokeromyces recurvatus]KAI7904074.1 hypothetical protein BX663DRAFT_506317 [Cokeromyces recurvatus]